MLKTVLIAAVVALALLLLFAATRPDTFHVQRSASIKAPPDKIFPFINDLTRMKSWNPFERKDPSVKGQFGNTHSGPGATYSWDSDKVGAGSMTIIEASAPTKVTMQLDFIKPFEGHHIAEYTLRPDGDSTRVTWAMHGPAPFISKLMQIFISMDRVIGKDFEDGLANLKTLAEGT